MRGLSAARRRGVTMYPPVCLVYAASNARHFRLSQACRVPFCVSKTEVLVGESQAVVPPGAGGRILVVAEKESERRKECVVRQHDPRDAGGCRAVIRRRGDPRRRRRARAGTGGPEAAGGWLSGQSVGNQSGLAGAGSIRGA